MNITETVSYDKDGRIERFPLFRRLFPSLVIILVATLSFGIGRLSVVGNREPIKVEYDPSLAQGQAPVTDQAATVIHSQTKPVSSVQQPTSSGVVASKNGSKYHYLYCAGAKQIKEENKIFFATPAAAEAAGYTLAANCLPK